MPAAHDNDPDIVSDVVIVGGGPAGLMAGLLFARAGVSATVLEKHGDFLRDFRGDTVHPSTLQLFADLGLLEQLLQLPHNRVDQVGLHIAGREMKIADFRHLRVAAPYIAMMPQWDLLDFLADKAGAYPGFRLHMSTEVVGAVTGGNGRVSGVRTADGKLVRAEKLVIAADGRRSVLRADAALPLYSIGAPMDVFWFRLDKQAPSDGESFGVLNAGQFLVQIDRGDYLQCAYLVPKGGADAIRQKGLENFRAKLTGLLPEQDAAIAQLSDWDAIKLLEVRLDRLTRWHKPGLLAIGDAAHAMSPIGGVGINVAVQDAVMAANILAGPIATGAPADALLGQVQKRRWRAVTRMQALQRFAQERIIAPILAEDKPITRPPLAVRLLNRCPWLRRIPGRVIGMGFDPVRIESPDAGD